MTDIRITRCAILGASGHGKVIADMAELNGYNEVHFFDDRWPKLSQVAHWQVLGDAEHLLHIANTYDLVVVAIGHNSTRLYNLRQLQRAGGCFNPLIHPSAVVSRYAEIGVGTVVMANAVINAFAILGEGCIVNTTACVEHDCVLADGVHISPGAKLAGAVMIGQQSWVGIGAQVKQLVSIGHNAVVGAGAAVINNVLAHQTVVGIPAKPIISK